MDDFRAAFYMAIGLLVGLDRELVAIVRLSLTVSLAAVSLAAVCGCRWERRWRYAGFQDRPWWVPCSMP